MLHDFVMERLHDFFGGCVIFFGGEVACLFCVVRLHFVERLYDFFLCGEVALFFHLLNNSLTFFFSLSDFLCGEVARFSLTHLLTQVNFLL